MTDEKIKTATSLYEIAERYNLAAEMVREVLDCYFRYCIDLLAAGYRVDFHGLASVVPNPLVHGCSTTMAYECYKVADALGRPRHTTYAVVRAFLDDCIHGVLSGQAAELRGILSVKPAYDEDGVMVSVRTGVSQQLKNKLDGVAVRVYSSRQLKETIRRAAS